MASLPPVGVLATLGSVGEAAAALVVSDRQRTAAYEEFLRRDWDLIVRGADGQWLGGAGLIDIAAAWRAAVVHAAMGHADARAAVVSIEARMREVVPSIMDVYGIERVAGVGEAQAMRSAVNEAAAESGRARDLDEALRAEAGALAQQVDPEGLRQLQREWTLAGRMSAAEAAGLLAASAEQAVELEQAVQVEQPVEPAADPIAEASAPSTKDGAWRATMTAARDDAAYAYANTEEWVLQWLLPTFPRPPGHGLAGARWHWCEEWWRHDEAALRLTALWHLWEQQRHGPAAMVAFLRELDYHLDRLLSDAGPFRDCRAGNTGSAEWTVAARHVTHEPQSVHPAPPNWWRPLGG